MNTFQNSFQYSNSYQNFRNDIQSSISDEQLEELINMKLEAKVNEYLERRKQVSVGTNMNVESRIFFQNNQNCNSLQNFNDFGYNPC